MSDVGGVSVVGLLSGGQYLPDIQMMIPHKVGVFIPIEKYLKSKDLHRAINSGVVFKLDSVIAQQQPESCILPTASLGILSYSCGNSS